MPVVVAVGFPLREAMQREAETALVTGPRRASMERFSMVAVMNRISVTIIAYNEEENIRECLESVKWADEIVVVDAGSKDKTVEISREYTDKVFINPWPGHYQQKNFAIDKTSHLWIFSIDADERVTPELRKEIETILTNPSFNGYLFPRKNFFLGKWMRHGGWYPDHVLRLFRKDKGRFGGINPHDKVIIEGERVGVIDCPIIHITYKDFSQYIAKQHMYTTISAEEIIKRKVNIRVSQWTLVGKFIIKFLELYILKRGFFDGSHGLIAAIAASYFALIKYAKVWEMQSKI